MRSYFLLFLSFFFSYSSAHITNNECYQLFDQLKETVHKQEERLKQAAQKASTVKKLMHGAPFRQGYTYLITWHEWRELGLGEYVQLFDRTHTAVGPWGLEQLTKPITDLKIIQARQKSIAYVDQHEDQMYRFCQLLDDIKRHEDALLAYYQEHDELSRNAQQLYYSYFTSVLNNSKIALDYAYLVDMCTSASNLATLLCLSGLCTEFLQAQIEGRSIHILDGIYKGFSDIISSHSPDDSTYQKFKQSNSFASSLPPYQVSAHTHESMFAPLSNLAGRVKHACHSVAEKITHPETINIVMQGSFGDKWSFYNEQCNLPSLVSFMWVIGQIAWQDHALYIRIKKNYKRLCFLYKTHVALQHRLVLIANWCASVKKLVEQAHKLPALREHTAVKRAYELLHDQQGQLHALLEQLAGSTYDEKKQLLYSRGQVLITHNLLKEIKMEFLPILQAVGIIDGFISVCRVYQEHKDNNEQPFCFAQIDNAQKPFYAMHDGWLPLIPTQHVANSCTLGVDQPCNLMLTGPNGGGKSSFLKLMGGSVVLAQSWGIVPAHVCKMSLFTGLRTSFNPQEDVKRDVSTFMAQKEHLAKLETYIKQADPTGCYMLLVDEPYRGTIEQEAERRAYRLAKELAHYQQCMMVMASHLRLPVDLASETGLFVNKQFQMEAHTDGSFTRTFRLCDGAAWWWFNDIEQRMRFIDWLHTNHLYEAL